MNCLVVPRNSYVVAFSALLGFHLLGSVDLSLIPPTVYAEGKPFSGLLARAPSFVRNKSTADYVIEVNEGNSAKIFWCFEGYPAPNITCWSTWWSGNGGQLPTDLRHLVHYHDGDANCVALEISNVTRMDEKKYHCSAANGVEPNAKNTRALAVSYTPSIFPVASPNITWNANGDKIVLTADFQAPVYLEHLHQLRRNRTVVSEDPRIQCSVVTRQGPNGTLQCTLNLPRNEAVGIWELQLFIDMYGGGTAVYCIDAWDLCDPSPAKKLSRLSDPCVIHAPELDRVKSSTKDLVVVRHEHRPVKLGFVFRSPFTLKFLWKRWENAAVTGVQEDGSSSDPGNFSTSLSWKDVTRNDMGYYYATAAVIDGCGSRDIMVFLNVLFQPTITVAMNSSGTPLFIAKPGDEIVIPLYMERPFGEVDVKGTLPSWEIRNKRRIGHKVHADLDVWIPERLEDWKKYNGTHSISIYHSVYGGNIAEFVLNLADDGNEADQGCWKTILYNEWALLGAGILIAIVPLAMAGIIYYGYKRGVCTRLRSHLKRLFSSSGNSDGCDKPKRESDQRFIFM